jgi:hypothetical protein
MPSLSGVCVWRRENGVGLDADDAGRSLVDRDGIPDGVGGVCRTSKSNGEARPDEAMADTLSKPAKYEKDSEFGSLMVLELLDMYESSTFEREIRLEGRADEMLVHSVVCRTRGVASLKNESGEIMPLSSSGVRGSMDDANENCRESISSSSVSSVVELQLEKWLRRVGRSIGSSKMSCSSSGVGGTGESDDWPDMYRV